ncbi:DUF4397 domain-containing protein [Pelomonas sp. Root1237]|uniref:DUF4397 domain-containing protein n=1 Tax=Pelomonas sp. Root1237 TaxID=1736434 RepID=UPI000700D403|nr:DUF4397 domain-containing protein [Pelomonas sp. Root1237]KQV96013.1 hypothetical protein ASC91_00130 [Pelomonas sp. Root1237]
MRFTPWATRLVLTLSLSATAFLTACGGGGGGSSDTQVRLLNATRSYSALSLSVNDVKINTGVAYASVGEYAKVDTANTATKVLADPVGTSVSALTPTLTSGTNYTFITYGFAGAIRTTLLQEAETAPAASSAKLLVLNLAPDAGAMDVYVTTATDDINSATALTTNLQGGAGSGYITLNSGTFRVRVTGYNKRTDLRLDIPAVTLDSASVNTLILTASDGGVLVNGITVVQKGAVKNFANTQSRVRTVAALTAGGTVGSSLNGQQMFSSAISPLISDYVTTASGASTLSTQVNGAPVSFTAPTLAAGKDYTLLVWGDAAAPKMSVLDDDNRLPTVNGNVKIRLVNALAAQTSGVSVNVDFSAIASNVLPGTASVPNSISSTTASQVDVTVPTTSSSIYTNAALAFPANSVWTFFAVPTTTTPGTATSPVPFMSALPKRERP